jgi:hypothetical protein
VRPRGDFGLAPTEKNIGMMALFLCDRAHFVYERERLAKVGKRKRTHDVVPIDDFPLRDFAREPSEFFAGERRDSAFAWNASLAG